MKKEPKKAERKQKAGEFRSIYTVLWDDENFATLSKDAKLLFFFLRCGPFSNMAGIFKIYPEACSEYLGLSTKVISRCLKELSQGLIIRKEKNFVWIRNALRFEPWFSLNNENHKVNVLDLLSGLPKINLVRDFCTYYKLPLPWDMGWDGVSHSESPGESHGESHGGTHVGTPKPITEPEPEPESEGESETETSTETKAAVGSGSPSPPPGGAARAPGFFDKEGEFELSADLTHEDLPPEVLTHWQRDVSRKSLPWVFKQCLQAARTDRLKKDRAGWIKFLTREGPKAALYYMGQ